MTAPATDVEPAAALADVLAVEVAALERLHYRVTQAAGLAAAGRHRFLAPAADEVMAAVDELAGLELARALLVADTAGRWGLIDDQPSLGELVAAAPAPWPPVLAALAERIRGLVAAIDDGAGAGHSYAGNGRDRVRGTLVVLEGGAGGYSPDGGPGGLPRSAFADRLA